MLYYAGTGARDYFRNPVPCRQRAPWEFQAVLSGKIAMTFPTGPEPLRAAHLWLSAPEHAHGWGGEVGRPAQVLVFHFLTIPEILARRLPERGGMAMALSKAQIRRLKEFSRLDWQQMHPEILLRSEHVLLELSLMILENLQATRPRLSHNEEIPAYRVRQALDWFTARMNINPSLHAVAQAVGCSVSQLRKHFYAVMQRAPKAVFDQLRFQRALQLLADPKAKLSWISSTCGFEEPSVFSRAFKTKLGVSPAQWRGSKVPPSKP